MVDEEENSTWYLTRRNRKDIWLEIERKQKKILILAINSYYPFCFFWKKFLTWTAKHQNLTQRRTPMHRSRYVLILQYLSRYKDFLAKTQTGSNIRCWKGTVCVCRRTYLYAKRTQESLILSVSSERFLKFSSLFFLISYSFVIKCFKVLKEYCTSRIGCRDLNK